ncbi:MAG: PKD-like family lipoprotein [Prevotella sp.]|nr:PKD-like family lipoprotein [Prevotella sp.]
MKTSIIKLLAFLLLPAFVTACYDDDSTLGDMSKVATIEVEEMDNVSIVSYSGNRLKVTPKIDTRLSDAEMDYAWYLVRPAHDTSVTSDFAGFRDEKISDQKELDYEVNLPSGGYIVVFEATDRATGLSAIQKMTVSVSTEFSKGFFILKDMGNGTAEIDLATDGGVMENLISKLTGSAMDGSPVGLSVNYSQCFIDDETNEMDYSTVVNIFTDKDYAAFRTEDMHRLFTKENIGFEDMSAVKFNNMVNSMSCLMLLTSEGIHTVGTGGEYTGVNSGKFGFPVEPGACKFIQPMSGLMNGLVYWNDDKHMLYSIDYNGGQAFPMDYAADGMDILRQKCIGSGYNFIGAGGFGGDETSYFLTEDNTSGQRFLYLINGAAGMVTDIVKLDNNLHISKAVATAGNALNATIIYCIDGGNLYAFDWNSGSEYAVPLSGIGNGEEICFITNSFFNLGGFSDQSENFNNLIVGTQKGSIYKLYFYDNIVGGVPVGKPVRTIEGQGKVKSIRYASSLSVSMDDLFMCSYFGMPMPYSD